jgi:hypothetical protein
LPFVAQTAEGEVFSGSALLFRERSTGTQAAALVRLMEAKDRRQSCHQGILTGVVLVKVA